MPMLEEIAYDAGRHALADQESIVSEIRRSTGTLLAAHALVASFLGAATHELYGQLYAQARQEVSVDSTEWLAAAGFGYVRVRERNARRVNLMSALSTALAVLMVLQTLAWIAELLG